MPNDWMDIFRILYKFRTMIANAEDMQKQLTDKNEVDGPVFIRNNIKFEKWMALDLAYIDNWSFRLDLLILFRTIRTVFKNSNH